jgi:hypothetical protein
MEQNWAEAELGGTVLKDRRRVKTLARTAAAVFDQPQLSLSAALGDGLRQAAGDLFRHPETRVADLMAGHVASTAERCRAYDFVVSPQDTCYVTYGQDQIVGLGPLNGSARGMVAHSALAVSPEGVPLGVLALRIWGATDPEATGLPVQVEPEVVECESAKWAVTLASIQQALPDVKRILVVADRESDVTGYLRSPRREGVDLLVRAVGTRKVVESASGADEGGPGGPGWLDEIAAKATVLGDHTVNVPARPAAKGCPAQKARAATLELRLAAVELPAVSETRAAPAKPAVRLWVIQALEKDPPAGAEPIRWLLLTTVEVADLDGAREMVRLYTLRWPIERLHYTLKSGLKAESLQIDDAHSLAHCLAVYYIVAWRLLYITHLAREAPNAPPTTVLTELEVQVLEATSGKKIGTLEIAVREIAKLGGYEHYPSKKLPPGVKVMWWGLQRLEAMVCGWQAALRSMRPPEI